MSTTTVETSEEIQARVEGQTVTNQFLVNVSDNSDSVALRWKDDDGGWSELTYGEMADQVARVAAGLSELGLGRGDRIMLMMGNIHEFHIADMAALMVGATPISIYNSSASDQVEFLTNTSKAKMAILEHDQFLSRFRAVADAMSTVEQLVVIDPATAEANEDVVSWADLVAHEPGDLAEMSAAVKPDDLVTVIFTSGTTGPSKGVMLTHNNICWTAECSRSSIGWEPEDYVGARIVSYLPMAHVAERMNSYYLASMAGYEVTCCPSPSEFAAYAAETRPHLMFGVPRVWEKIYGGVNAALSADPEKKAKMDEAIEAAAPIAEKMTMGTATEEEQATYDFLDQVAFSTVRELVGLDQVKLAITGAAPIPAEMMSWFRTIGVPLSEVYGLSETCGPMTWDAYRVKAGTVGRAIPGCEVKLAEADDEVICRGGNVFAGYLDAPEKTAEVLDADGWFHSGDIGVIDDEGYLKIVDRKKELIITAGGKNLSPSNLEARLKMIPLVGQAAAIGDNRPFVSALVVLDPDEAPAWATQHGIEYSDMEELAAHPDVVAEIEAGLEEAMAPFNNAERVKRVKVLGAEWLPDSELLTPTSKLKRRGINAQFTAEIEALYS